MNSLSAMRAEEVKVEQLDTEYEKEELRTPMVLMVYPPLIHQVTF
jgi:hypothetical protein